MGVGKPNLLHLRKLIMNYDVLIERNVLKEIKKFPAHDVDRIKKAGLEVLKERNLGLGDVFRLVRSGTNK